MPDATPPIGPLLPVKLLLTKRDLATALNKSVRTVDRMDAVSALPAAIRVGSTKCWRRADIEAWIERGCPPRTPSTRRA